MRVIRALPVIALLLAGGALSAQVKTDHDETFDFSTIRTYSIGIGTSWGNPLAERRVVASLDSVLQTKGWTRAPDPDSADAAVVIHGGVGKKQDLRIYYSGSPYAGYRWGGGAGTVSTHVYEYPYGALVVDIFDLKTRLLVYRGSAEGELSTKEKENRKKVVKAWQKMFRDFPPRAGKP
jgi:hypothetical protein